MKHTNFFKKFGSKSKTPDPYRNSCQNPVMEFAPQPSSHYPYHHPQPFHLQPQIYTQPLPQNLPVSPCSCQCHPQQHVVQSPQHHQQQQQQSLNTCTQYRNGTLDSRMTDSTIMMSSQISLPPSNSTSTLPAYHTINQLQTTVSNHSIRYADNLYYNQMAIAPVNSQHQNHQQQQQPQKHSLQHQQQQQQENHFQAQQQNGNHNGHQLEDQQRHKQNQCNMLEQQMSHMTLQPHHVETQQRHLQHQQDQQQQHHHHHHQQQQQQNQHQQLQHQIRCQPQHQPQDKTSQLPQQQQYQNHQVVENELSYCDGDLPLEGLCMMYESTSKELSRLASVIKNDLSKLNEELAIIKRRELPDYSVSEARI